jgi:Fe2+ or Zn2+ uptake regulation protein
MDKDREIIEVIRELARTRGRVISITTVYKNITAKGIYTSNAGIKNALRRLETRGIIKSTTMDKIELLEGSDEK